MTDRSKLMVIAESPAAELYRAILGTGGYDMRVFSYGELELGTHTGKALEEISTFCPHVVVLHYESADTDAFVARLKQQRDKGDSPLILVTASSDVWCESADMCIPSPVGVEVLYQAVEDLLHSIPSR